MRKNVLQTSLLSGMLLILLHFGNSARAQTLNRVEGTAPVSVPKMDTVRMEESIDLKTDYAKVMGLKFKRNKGYRKNAFENKDNYALLEKHVSLVSFNIGLASYDIDNKWIEPIAKIDDTYYRKLSAKLSLGYFVGNNMAIAARFAYGFYDTRINVNSDILQLLINAKQYETSNAGYSFSGAVSLRNYIPIGVEQRFFVVSETSIFYTRQHSLSRNIYDDGVKISKVSTVSDQVGLGISPGITYFMTKGFAFEFALNPIMIYYKRAEMTNNEINKGSSKNYGLSFSFMPFNIQMGFAYYFGLDYQKNQKYLSKYYNKVK